MCCCSVCTEMKFIIRTPFFKRRPSFRGALCPLSSGLTFCLPDVYPYIHVYVDQTPSAVVHGYIWSVGTQQSRPPRLFCLPGVRQRIAPCAICRPPWLFAVAYACGSITLSDVGSMPEGGAPGSAEGTCLSLAVHGKPVGRTDILQVGGGTGPVLTARR